MRVAIVEPVGGHSGMDYYDFGLCQSLATQGVEVTLYTCEKTIVPEAAAFRIQHTFKGIYGDSPKWMRGIRYIAALLATFFDIQRSGITLVHFHFFYVTWLELLGVWFAKLLRLYVVITVHDVTPFIAIKSTGLARRAYQEANLLILNSNVALQEMTSQYPAFNAKMVHIAMGNLNHMCKETVSRADASKRLNLDEHAFRVLFFGQIKAVKGLDILLKALPIVYDQVPNVELVVAGRPWKDDFTKYQTMIDQYQIGDRCKLFLSFIKQEEMKNFFAVSDVIVLPYKRIYQSAVLFSAIAHRRPVIVSDLPAFREIVTNGETALLHKSEDAVDLARCLIEIYRSPDLATQLPDNAYRHVAQHFNWDIIGRETVDAYRKLVEISTSQNRD